MPHVVEEPLRRQPGVLLMLDHEKLDVYQLSLELLAFVYPTLEQLP